MTTIMKKIRPNPDSGGLPCDQIDVEPGYQLTPEEQAAGWQLMSEELFGLWVQSKQPAALSATTATVLDRLTPAERRAINQAQQTDIAVWTYLSKALALGRISADSPDFQAARDYLAGANLIAWERWTETTVSEDGAELPALLAP